MTRLRTGDIKDISGQLADYDRELLDRTGQTLRGIACRALDISEEDFQSLSKNVTVGVVPIRGGEGVIEGFSHTVKDIVKHIGFNVFVTDETDVGGIAGAVERGAEVVMMADDSRFVALNVKQGRVVDNAEATAKGFVAGLDLMVGGLKGQTVLVIGCGPVGRNAALAAFHRGAGVSVFDIDDRRSLHLAREVETLTGQSVHVERSFEDALRNHHLLVEATNAAGIIVESFITPEMYIAAPGMPLGLTSTAVEKISHRLLHDPLQLGVAVMALEAAMPYKSNLATKAQRHKAPRRGDPIKRR